MVWFRIHLRLKENPATKILTRKTRMILVANSRHVIVEQDFRAESPILSYVTRIVVLLEPHCVDVNDQKRLRISAI